MLHFSLYASAIALSDRVIVSVSTPRIISLEFSLVLSGQSPGSHQGWLQLPTLLPVPTPRFRFRAQGHRQDLSSVGRKAVSPTTAQGLMLLF